MGIPCTLIPGDGIGPDITDATLRILEAAGAHFEWDWQLAGMAAVTAVRPHATRRSTDQGTHRAPGPPDPGG
jgi:isocitrate/isopropylmalate dehydrogenase